MHISVSEEAAPFDQSLSNPAIRRAVLNQELNSRVGGRYIVTHLTSERGRELNGRSCLVIGHDGSRLLVRMEDDDSLMKLKAQNLLPIETSGRPHATSDIVNLSDSDVLLHLRAACSHSSVRELLGPDTRPDIMARVKHVEDHLALGLVPPPTPCMDPMIPLAEMEPVATFMYELRPCCHGADAQVDFRRFAAGLIGTGGTCAICLEDVTRSAQGALGFPCGHLFHNACASEWLENNNTCPQCRFTLKMPGSEYKFMFKSFVGRLETRMREWFLSGMCECCQAAFHETDPLIGVPCDDGTTRLVPRSALGGGSEGFFRAANLHGQGSD